MVLWALIWSIHHGHETPVHVCSRQHFHESYKENHCIDHDDACYMGMHTRSLIRPAWRRPSDRGGYHPTITQRLLSESGSLSSESPDLDSYTFDINRPQAKVVGWHNRPSHYLAKTPQFFPPPLAPPPPPLHRQLQHPCCSVSYTSASTSTSAPVTPVRAPPKKSWASLLRPSTSTSNPSASATASGSSSAAGLSRTALPTTSVVGSSLPAAAASVVAVQDAALQVLPSRSSEFVGLLTSGPGVGYAGALSYASAGSVAAIANATSDDKCRYGACAHSIDDDESPPPGSDQLWQHVFCQFSVADYAVLSAFSAELGRV